MEKTVVELFAGVGGFRVGLNHITKISKSGKAIEHGDFNIVWTNQWEPSTKAQQAFDCYVTRFGLDNCSNTDISLVDKETIPDHTLLVGGFPCQDYSVARSLSKEKGIEGKKGVLWWQIRDILEAKKPPFVLLENVDRLIKSPSTQRGRDFGIMLRCFNELGYSVEWRVINAADYGMTQRRRRLYIVAYRNETKFAKLMSSKKPIEVMTKDGIIASTFKVEDKIQKESSVQLEGLVTYDLVDFSDSFSYQFLNTGYMSDGQIYTALTIPISKKPVPLSSLLEPNVSDDYYLTDEKIDKYKYLRGKKKVLRHSKSGFDYYYSEGSMKETDDLEMPGRTMLTSEGTTNRTTHIVIDPETNKTRLLTPLECERLNMFPDGWTDTGMSERKRYFMMGNALVCGIINEFGKTLSKVIGEEDE